MLNVAVLGADEPLGEALLKELEERDLTIGALYPLSLGEEPSDVSFNGEDLVCEAAQGFDWADADLVIVASRAQGARAGVEAALAAGRRVVGLGEALASLPDAVFVDPANTRLEGAGPWLAPDAVATMIAKALRPLASALGVERAEAFACLAVSARGNEGVEELREQVTQLFGMGSVEPGVFPLQIAFNLVPQVGAVDADGSSLGEAAASLGLACLLQGRPAHVGLTMLWVPVFYGHGVALHLAGGEGLSLENVRSRLGNAPGLVLMDEHLPGGCPTPVTDAAESTDVFVGRLRQDGNGRVQLWLVGDNVRLEAANLAAIAERVIEKRLN